MCFMLFVGTDEPLPLKEWRKEAPDVCAQLIGEDETGERIHFNKPIVQYVGSTSGCGCDFPHWILYNGEVPDNPAEFIDPEQSATHEQNRQALVKLLEGRARGSAEVYGVWADNYAKAPKGIQEISLDRIRQSSFLFGEQIFYRVQL
jgi:hypothetical protein